MVHNYHDRAQDNAPEVVEAAPRLDKQGKRRRGPNVLFPTKLHEALDQIEADGLASVISWQPHGRAFVVHKPKEFVVLVLPKYFKQSKLTSFQRQLSLYDFKRITDGPDRGGYYHELFLWAKPFLAKGMTPTKVKGTGIKPASLPDQEPDLYQMAVVPDLRPGQQQLVQYQLSERMAKESRSRKSIERKQLTNQIVAAALPKHPVPIMIKPPEWAKNASDLLNPYKCRRAGMGGQPPLYHISDIAPSALYRLPHQLDRSPHIHGGSYVNKRNGPEYTKYVYAGHSLEGLFQFAELNHGRAWISSRRTLYIYEFECQNAGFGIFEACTVSGGLGPVQWYTRSDESAKPNKCFKATPTEEGEYIFEEVEELSNIMCNNLPPHLGADQ